MDYFIFLKFPLTMDVILRDSEWYWFGKPRFKNRKSLKAFDPHMFQVIEGTTTLLKLNSKGCSPLLLKTKSCPILKVKR